METKKTRTPLDLSYPPRRPGPGAALLDVLPGAGGFQTGWALREAYASTVPAELRAHRLGSGGIRPTRQRHVRQTIFKSTNAFPTAKTAAGG